MIGEAPNRILVCGKPWTEPTRVRGPAIVLPHAHDHDGKLCVVYSMGKEDCGLTTIPIDALTAQ